MNEETEESKRGGSPKNLSNNIAEFSDTAMPKKQPKTTSNSAEDAMSTSIKEGVKASAPRAESPNIPSLNLGAENLRNKTA